ncbi:L,D-transpeptidase family protein [Aestuariivirga litoralis]|uniref:L,D-transpeptidase family protein n=1 Tax=Aestuariivirga litoralis TaxID=2650924 RepID=UPI0018C5005E|nr:L,D-transpeptidase family protein [Aestuariivirga litoralis]MBG1233313.1 L,D-transpeptidase family protein [Aestuariivirga litoralis]
MSKQAAKLLFGLSVLALLASPASAEQRKANFFDLLFGQNPNRQRANNNNDGGDRPWWQNDGSNSFDQGTPKKRAQVVIPKDAGSGPDEQVSGLGMGTVTYAPPPILAVFDPTFATLTTTTPEAGTIRDLLANKATPIKAQDAEKKAILAYYKTSEFKPVWVQGGHVTEKGLKVLKLLARAQEEGMVAKNYIPEVLTDLDNMDASVADDPAKQARLEVGITLAALHYARQLSGGQFEPNRLSLYNDIKPTPVDADEAIRGMTTGVDPVAYLEDQAPPQPQYKVFKDELAKLSANTTVDFDPIKAGPTVKSGKSDPRMSALRARLIQLNFLPENSIIEHPDLLDQDMAIGLMAFQTSSKLKPTGNLDANTIKALNRDDTKTKRQRLIASMERLRWLPRDMGIKYVFVNQPAYEATVMANDGPLWKTKVIIGQPTKQTYSFYNQIQTVVFNPKWGVPASIIVNEYAPKMRKDPGYLDRNGFVVVDQRGRQIDTQSVDWYNVGKNPNFGLQQLAGDGNALGELKFLFPNAHDIYMHDTPTKNLFNSQVRAFSHGCVRTQNPREYASILLGWDKDKVAENLADGQTKSVALTDKVPVYMTYFTAWTDGNGAIQYYDDVYGRDEAMAKAFAYAPAVKAPAVPANVAQTTSGTVTQN